MEGEGTDGERTSREQVYAVGKDGRRHSVERLERWVIESCLVRSRTVSLCCNIHLCRLHSAG